jgi:LysR family transcriptional activator of nhaA
MINQLNYKHLYYFWMVAKSGSIALASEQLHVTPQTISGQLSIFEEAQGEKLFQKTGRNLELTETGRVVLSYAEEIFSLGQELEQLLQQETIERSLLLRVGVSDAISKAVAFRLIEPAFSIKQPVRIHCREGRLHELLGDLALHKLDIVISDSTMPSTLNVRAYNHPLGRSGVSIFAMEELRNVYSKPFPQCLDGAPYLMPGEDSALRSKLMHWFRDDGINPRIVGEFDDSALLKAFGRGGRGFFAAPTAIMEMLLDQAGMRLVGHIPHMSEQFFAISVQRKITHPAVLAISQSEPFAME